MAEDSINGRMRKRQMSVEETTTKLIYQRQGFVLYMPKVHKKHLGLDVEFPHKFVAQTVDSLDGISRIKFDQADVEAITENIKRLHHLAVTKYDDIDDDLTPKFSKKEAGKGEQALELRAPEIQAMYDEVPLSFDSREFRVLDVLPGWRGSPIKCHLFSASSMLEINYEALSYAWGQSKEMKYKIEVNDCSMPVTTNLHNALQSLRYPDKSRLIWIDAICIDQRNGTEKMTQLPMMGDIYRIAKRVCVYLGEADDESDYLLRVLEEHQDLQSPIGTRVQETPKWTATMDYLRANEDRIIHSLICLMHRQWFERLWIYQEYHIATREPQIYIGSHSVSAGVMFGSLFGFLSDVCALPSIWTSEKLHQVSHSLSIVTAQTGDAPFRLRFSELRRKVRLCTAAVHTNDLMPRYPCFWLADAAIAAAKCFAEEDKVYGIIGMFDPIAREILKPIKDMHFKDVFMRVTAWCLLVDNVIFYTFTRYHLLLDVEYPSWTLAYDKPIPDYELPDHVLVKQEKVFPDMDPLAKACIVHQQVLYIEGIEFSTIDNVCVMDGADGHERLKRLWHFEQRLALRTTNDPKAAHTVTGGVQNQILHWATGFSGKLISWLTRHVIFYELILSGQFPDFPETEAYPSGDALQELLGGLLFDSERLIKELYEACELAATDPTTASSTTLSSSRYSRLGRALFGADVVENARALRVVYDALETLVPSTFDEESSKLYLEQHGYSTTDARHNAQTLIAGIAAEGDTIDENTALNYMYNQTYNFANLRDEYSQRLLNSTFFITMNGTAGLGAEGSHGYQPGDKIVFFREMPTAMAIRCCKEDEEAFRFVGIVQMEGLLAGSIYERPEIKEGRPRLFEIR